MGRVVRKTGTKSLIVKLVFLNKVVGKYLELVSIGLIDCGMGHSIETHRDFPLPLLASHSFF